MVPFLGDGAHIISGHLPGYNRTSDAFSPMDGGGGEGTTSLVEDAFAVDGSEIVCRGAHTCLANS